MIVLSMDWHASHFLFGDSVTDGIECIHGSLRYFITTGMPYSHTRIDLSSDEVMNRRPASVNVIEFTAARCWSYSCTILSSEMAHWMIFLSACPTRNSFCASSIGLNAQQYGIFFVVYEPMHCPVSVSQSLQ